MNADSGTVKRRLQKMDDYDFEYFVADLWERRGWECEVSQASVDAGIDVTATKSTPYNQKKLIQAKRYGENTTVGGPDIQQYASLKHQQPDADSVVVVTSNRFTSSAKDRAKELNVKLVDGDALAGLVTSLDAYDLLERYDPQPNHTVDESAGDAMVGDGMGVAHKGDTTTQESVDATSDPRDGDGIFSPDSSPAWLHRLERSRQWHRLIPVGIVLWFIAVAVAGTLDGAGSVANMAADVVGYGLIWPLMLAIPLAWYLDMRYVRSVSDWRPTFPKYVIISIFTAGLPMVYYYYKRYTTVGL